MTASAPAGGGVIRVGVCGATGRMGAQTVQAISEDPGTELVGGIDSQGSVSQLLDAGAEVVVDFTVAEAARATLAELARHGVHAVVGTSGLDADDHANLRAAFVSSHCLISPNFAIGAALMVRFAAMASRYFDTAEVIEMHHNAKVDAPSGTALLTAAEMAAASDDWAADPTKSEAPAGARGGSGPGGIPIHSVRLRGLVAHQQVMLGGPGETLVIRHDTIDRSCFMPGVLAATKQIVGMEPGVTVGLGEFLGI